jgi:hypothetical protein
MKHEELLAESKRLLRDSMSRGNNYQSTKAKERKSESLRKQSEKMESGLRHRLGYVIGAALLTDKQIREMFEVTQAFIDEVRASLKT